MCYNAFATSIMIIHFYRFWENLRSSLIRKNKFINMTAIIALLFNLTTWGLIWFKFKPLVQNLPLEAQFIPLHYNIFVGIDSYGAWQKIFYLPAIGLAIWAINFFLAFIFYNQKNLLSYFLAAISVLCQLFLLIATILIILINI
jgi:hypothetical protein